MNEQIKSYIEKYWEYRCSFTTGKVNWNCRFILQSATICDLRSLMIFAVFSQSEEKAESDWFA